MEKRDSATLIALIEKWISPGTTTISDSWKAYSTIEDIGKEFKHLTVIHSLNFVDLDTSAHTNTVERSWHEVRATMPRFGVKEHHFYGYLAEFHVKRRYPDMERMHKFFTAAANMYRSLY